MVRRRDGIGGGVTEPEAGSRLQLHRCGTNSCRNRAHLQKQRLHPRIGRRRSEDAGLLLELLQPVAQYHGYRGSHDKKHDGRGGVADIAPELPSAFRRGRQVRRRQSRDITGSKEHPFHRSVCAVIQAGVAEHFRHRAGHMANGERIVDQEALGEYPPIAGARLLRLGEVDRKIGSYQVLAPSPRDQLGPVVDIGYLAVRADGHQRIETCLDQTPGILRGRAQLLLARFNSSISVQVPNHLMICPVGVADRQSPHEEPAITAIGGPEPALDAVDFAGLGRVVPGIPSGLSGRPGGMACSSPRPRLSSRVRPV